MSRDANHKSNIRKVSWYQLLYNFSHLFKNFIFYGWNLLLKDALEFFHACHFLARLDMRAHFRCLRPMITKQCCILSPNFSNIVACHLSWPLDRSTACSPPFLFICVVHRRWFGQWRTCKLPAEVRKRQLRCWRRNPVCSLSIRFLLLHYWVQTSLAELSRGFLSELRDQSLKF